ncbi:hypothetical protein RQP46_011408 [Phenoliferia psychrophenolica]
MAAATPTLTVIGAGLPRTGTSSLQEALHILGLAPCYHMNVVADSAARSKQWIDLYQRQARGLPLTLAPLFAGFKSSLDSPASSFAPELAKEFPNAKVVLTHRSGESWAKSIKVLFFHHTWSHFLATFWSPKLYWQNVLVDRHVFPHMARVYGCPFGSAEMMEKRTAEIKAAIPAERLLIFRVEEGWEPLCTFLGVPIPDVPFPRKNDKAEMEGVSLLTYCYESQEIR